MQFSTVAALSALSASAMAAYSNATVVTTDITVTGYTTYCPESTVVTVTTCDAHACAPSTITVSQATTLTVTAPCVVPTTYTTEYKTITKSKASSVAPVSSVAPASSAAPVSSAHNSTTAAVSSFKGTGAKNAAGLVAGAAAIAAALL